MKTTKRVLTVLVALAAVMAAAGGALALSENDLKTNHPLSAYFTDPQNVYVEERAAEAFDLINEILCMVGQTKADKLLNWSKTGAFSAADPANTVTPYRAQIDKNLCSGDQDSASSAGSNSSNQTSGATSPDYIDWTVKSFRASNLEPQTIQAWIHEPGEADVDFSEPDKLIRAKAVISEGASATNPLGQFAINYVMNREDSNSGVVSDQLGKGFVKSVREDNGDIILRSLDQSSFSMNGQSMMERISASLWRSSDGTSGNGTTKIEESSPKGARVEQFDFAFNSNYFLRKDKDGNQVCLDRGSYEESVWRYGMYDGNGARVTRNSGFPIIFTATKNGVPAQVNGYVSYYGLWTPMGEGKIADGTLVKKATFGGGNNVQTTDYTVRKKGGKLIKHTKQELRLGDLKRQPLQYSICPSGGGQCTNYRVEWDGSQFNIVAKLVQNDDNNYWGEPGAGETSVSLSGLFSNDLNLWSQERGGSLRVKLDNCSTQQNTSGFGPSMTFTCQASDTTRVLMFVEDVVYPKDSVPSTLYCLDRCFKPDTGVNSTNQSTYANTVNPGSPFYNDSTNGSLSMQPSATAKYHTYSFDTTDMGSGRMVLKTAFDASNSPETPVISGGNNNVNIGLKITEASTAPGASSFGQNSGPMFDAASKALLACTRWDNSAGICGFKAWELDTFYTWETGANAYNKLTVLVDGSGNPLKFERPLSVTYLRTRQVGGQAVTSKYTLDYSGFGDLHGIPGQCLSWDTGTPVSCGPNTRWVPEFSIPDGAQVCAGTIDDNGTCSGTPYLVKGLDKSKQMKKGDDGCGGLSTTTRSLPTEAEWVDPALGDEPAVSDPPKVIGGVIQ